MVQKKSELEIEKAKSAIELKISAELEKSIAEKYELQLAEKEKQGDRSVCTI